MGKLMKRLEGVLCCWRVDSKAYAEHSHPEGTANPSLTNAQSNAPQYHITSEKPQPEDGPAELTPFQQQARQIAQIPVAGMRRTTGPGGMPGGYVTTYQTMQSPGRGPTSGQPKTMPSHSTLSSSGTTMVGAEEQHLHDEKKPSAWQGKPKGTPYDRREELTEEDEDAWARMAM